MEPLPLTVDGESVYVGPSRRLGAALLDGLIFLPVLALELFVRRLSSGAAVGSATVYLALVLAYRVVFMATRGGTPGKLILGIRITKPDGTRIGWSEAFRRVSVDLALGVIILLGALPFLLGMPPLQYEHLGHAAKLAYQKSTTPWWGESLNALGSLWTIADVGAILFNQQKRALHDRIAGTVVINQRFAVSATHVATNVTSALEA